ncbi:MAG: ribose-5-phosphate isomerase RpiA [Myxococcaceae bacterium]
MASPQDEAKAKVAQEALEHLVPGTVLGVGTGSTVNFFIEALRPVKHQVKAAVSSSNASSERLKALGITVLDLNEVTELELYVDGADETNAKRQLIKGGGGALTREKIVAAAAKRYVCIVDESKVVEVLGKFPLPVEVIPMARELIARQLRARGGDPKWRQGFVTDNGGHILDVHGLKIADPVKWETELNQLPGVVSVGLFAQRPADVVLVASPSGVREL